MGVSIDDIALTIVANDERAYYSAVKGIGHLIWDMRLGVFSDTRPDAKHALDFLEGSNWEDCTRALNEPLADPVYGNVTVDFDKKIILDANVWGLSTRMFFDWLESSVVCGIDGRDEGLIPVASLIEHFKCSRIQIESGPCAEPFSERLCFSNLNEALDSLRTTKIAAMRASRPLAWAHIDLPHGWHHEVADDVED